MSDIAGVAVSLDVARPLELGRVRMTRADVASLELLKLLLGAKLIRLHFISVTGSAFIAGLEGAYAMLTIGR